MQISRRPLRPGELDHELIWLTVSLAGLAMAAVWLRAGLPWPYCLFLALTGFPCPTCGATRCGIAFFQLRFLDAFWWNPLFFIFCVGLAIFDVYAAFVLATRAPRVRLVLTTGEKQAFRWIAITIIAVNWIYLIVHASRYR